MSTSIVSQQNYYNEVTYEAIYKKPLFQNALSTGWAFFTCWSFLGLAWFEVWSKPLLAFISGTLAWYAATTMVAWAKSILMVESFGYLYHRFFQHLGLVKRAPGWMAVVQKIHQRHHNDDYPAGSRYVYPSKVYVTAERHEKKEDTAKKGKAKLLSSWSLPGIIFATLYLMNHGLDYESLMVVVGIGFYAIYIIDATHVHFHCYWWHEKVEDVAKRMKLQYLEWLNKIPVVCHLYQWFKRLLVRYLQWLNKIHFLHHVYQWGNFTIFFPVFDWLNRTLIALYQHQWVFEIARRKNLRLSEFDFANLVYLLEETAPSKQTAFIMQAEKSFHKQQLLKDFVLMSRQLKEEKANTDKRASRKFQEWIDKAVELLRTLKTQHSEKILVELAV